MSPALVQDVIVALVALGAALVVARRVIGFAAAETYPKCANCASSACAPPSTATGPAGSPAEHPLVFIRSPH